MRECMADLLRIGALAAVLAVAGPSLAQAPPPAARPVQPPTVEVFVLHATSSSLLQAQASEIATRKETRPEVRGFAQQMVQFRQALLPRLEALARDKQLAAPKTKVFEHQMVFENLEPLDALEFSRRYAEMVVQALEQELPLYGVAQNASDDAVKNLAAEMRPQLEQKLREAQQTLQAVKP